MSKSYIYVISTPDRADSDIYKIGYTEHNETLHMTKHIDHLGNPESYLFEENKHARYIIDRVKKTFEQKRIGLSDAWLNVPLIDIFRRIEKCKKAVIDMHPGDLMILSRRTKEALGLSPRTKIYEKTRDAIIKEDGPSSTRSESALADSLHRWLVKSSEGL